MSRTGKRLTSGGTHGDINAVVALRCSVSTTASTAAGNGAPCTAATSTPEAGVYPSSAAPSADHRPKGIDEHVGPFRSMVRGGTAADPDLPVLAMDDVEDRIAGSQYSRKGMGTGNPSNP